MLDLKALLSKILNMSLYDTIFTPILNGGGVGYVRFKGFIGEGADQSPVVVLQCVRERLPQLLQGAKSWQSCSCLGRILKRLDNHARC